MREGVKNRLPLPQVTGGEGWGEGDHSFTHSLIHLSGPARSYAVHSLLLVQPHTMHPPPEQFVHWFRSAAPYINAFRGRTFVIAFGGEVVADGKFVALTHDLNLLASLGVRLVLV